MLKIIPAKIPPFIVMQLDYGNIIASSRQFAERCRPQITRINAGSNRKEDFELAKHTDIERRLLAAHLLAKRQLETAAPWFFSVRYST